MIGVSVAIALLVLLPAVGLSVFAYAPAVEAHGHEATLLLDETHFPHATTSSLESYQFARAGPNISDLFTLRIDWKNHQMVVENASLGQATIVVILPEGTYADLEARLLALQHGAPPPPPASYLRLWNDIVLRSSVSISGKDHLHVILWKWDLTKWAARNVDLAQRGELAG